MNKHISIFIPLVAMIAGMLLFCMYYEYIIIRIPSAIPKSTLSSYSKKNVTLYYWNSGHWCQESSVLVWADQREENLLQLLNAWLYLMEEQELCAKKITVQTIISSPNPTLVYCSFDRLPLAKEWSIHRKWMFMEGLLKTVREHFPSIRSIRFLIRHQPLIDIHFDFSHAWPIEGFVSPLQ